MDPRRSARLLVTPPRRPAGRDDDRLFHSSHERGPLAGIRRAGAYESHPGRAAHAGSRAAGGGPRVANTDSVRFVDASAGDFHLVRRRTRVGAAEATHT